MNRSAALLTTLVAVGMISSIVAFPLLSGGGLGALGSDDGDGDDVLESEVEGEGVASASTSADASASDDLDLGLVQLESTSSNPAASLSQEHEDAVEQGVDEGIELVQSQGVDVSQEQRTAAVEGALESVAQHQEAEVEQVQSAVKGATHGTLVQEQDVNVSQVQAAVGGASGGALTQHQSANATQMQSASWGASHGAIAQTQKQQVTVEQVQMASHGAAAGAAHEAAAKETKKVGKTQEAAQGAAYGAIEQYQKISVEQRQRITIEHVQHAAAGAAAGALDGATLEQDQRVEVEQEQRVEIEQYQRVTIKQTQKAAMGAAGGALDQRQEVTVEQTQAAARGGGKGSLVQLQRISITQIQKITITQIQEASFGAAKGSIYQSQEATVEQIQAAAEGSAGGVLVQTQEVSVVQTQSAAVGAAKGAVGMAVQEQVVEVEQIQAAARGAGEGSVTQIQVVNVVQVQVLAEGAARGSLSQHQTASVTQIQSSAKGSSQATAKQVQNQRISVTQLQQLSEATATDTTVYAVEQEIDDEAEIEAYADEDAAEKAQETEEREGEATVALSEQTTDGDTVVVDAADLSEGGFVAVYDSGVLEGEPLESVRGVSAYLEPGEHEDVEIELDEPLAENATLVAMAHFDTTGDETFQYVESDGADDDLYVGEGGVPVLDSALVTLEDEDEVEDEPEPEPEPEANLSVTDQTGDGTTLMVDEANASVDYYLAAEYEDERVESETFDAGETIENHTFELEPPIEENTTVDVSVVAAGDGVDANDDEAGAEPEDEAEELVTESIEYTLEDDPELEPEGTLNVSDQAGNGTTLTVDEANASVSYVVAAEYDDERTESEVFDAGETIENHTLELEPPIEENRTVEVTVEAADGEIAVDGEAENGADTDGEDETDADPLASETIEYTLVVETEPASVVFEDQESDGTAVTVESVGIPEGGFVAIYDDSVLEDAETDDVVVDADATDAVLGVSDFLDPDAVDVGTEDAEDGEHENVTVDLFDEESVPGAEFDVEELEDGEHTLVAVVHEETTGNDVFEFVESEGTADEPSLADDEPVADDAVVTVEPEPPVEPAVEFLNCTAAEITGDVSQVRYTQDFYAPEGFGNVVSVPQIPWDEFADGENATILQIGAENDAWERDDGTRVVQIAEQGSFGETDAGTQSILQGVEFEDEDGLFGETHTNPDGAECIDQVRPELPDLSVVDAVPVDGEDEDGIEVTFGYENPNDAPVFVSSAFVEGTTADQPPDELEVGEETFTVDWTPESDDEQLVWEVGLEDHGYDEPISVATDTAGEIAPTEPAEFTVDITGTNSPVEEGETLEVSANLENVGGDGDSQEITLALDGTVVDGTQVSLEPGESESLTLVDETSEGDAGEYTAEIASENDSDGTQVTIEEAAEPAFFAVTDVSAPESAEPGEEISVTATIENEGDLEDTTSVSHFVDGALAQSTDVTLAGDEAVQVTFSAVIPEGATGSTTQTVETGDASATATVSILEPDPETPTPADTPEPETPDQNSGEEQPAEEANGAA
ncbi:DUF7282 domain-containing protein [Natronoglomus mannanivorans]|uniref:CARDB protein n=1 Tax=Natronoglomus mannanivorans TaxID=2979990 RepID=A0AAP3DZV8_9EURY|nr:hypothetical protein [Halobacteria archaeon AArc-xg1-1]